MCTQIKRTHERVIDMIRNVGNKWSERKHTNMTIALTPPQQMPGHEWVTHLHRRKKHEQHDLDDKAQETRKLQ